MERIRIGNDIAISWALFENNGATHLINAGGASVSLNCGGYTYLVPSFSVQGNVVSFIFPAENQVKTGKYKIVLTERNESGLVSSYDVRDAFVLVPENEMLNVGYTQQKNVEITSVITHAAIANIKTISIVESEEEGGDNVVTFVLTDGSQFPMTVKNGSKGDKGDKGDQGIQGEKGDKGDTGARGPAGIEEAEVTVDGTTGTPAVEASIEEGVLSLAFSGLKGEKGDKGDKGNTGSSVDFPYELVTDVETDDDEKGLAASQGVVLDNKISQLGQPLLLSDKETYYGIISIKTNIVITSLILKQYYNRNVSSGYSQVLQFDYIRDNGETGTWLYTSTTGTIRTGIEQLELSSDAFVMKLTIDWQNSNSAPNIPINLNAVDFSFEKQIPAAIESAQDGENVSLQLKNADNQNIGSPATFSTAPKNAIFYSPIAGVSFGNKTGDVYFKNVLKYIYIVSYFDDVLQAEYGEVLSTLHVGLLRNRTSDNSFIIQIRDSDNSIVFSIATTKKTGKYIIANNGYSKYGRFLYCYLGFDFTGHTEDVNYAPELSTIDTTFSFNELNRLPITQDVTLYNQVEKTSNSLLGKTVVCFGDSLTEFKDSTNELRYSDYLQMITGAKVINVGVGGTQIRQRTSPVTTPTTNEEAYAALDIVNMVKAVCEDDYSKQVAAAEFLYNGGSGDDNRAIIDELQRIDWENVDIVTIFAGTNDWANGGSMIGTPDSTDINYTLGAVNYIIQSLLTTYNHLQILWFTPTVRWASAIADRNDSNWCDVLINSGDKTLKEFVDGIIDTVKNNHLEICDLYRIGWNKYNFSQYFTDTDGVHPKKGFYNIGCRFASFISSHCII